METITVKDIESLGYVKSADYDDYWEYRIANTLNIAILYCVDGPRKGAVREYDNNEMAWSIAGSIFDSFDELKTYTQEKITDSLMEIDIAIKEAKENKKLLSKALKKLNKT